MTPLGIYIGRFQPFHNGHRSVVRKMIGDNQENIIILGTLDIDNNKNLYSADWRQEAIQKVFPNIEIQTLEDNPDDMKWIQNLKELLESYTKESYTFYCGDRANDYAIQVIEKYKNVFQGKEINIQEIPRQIIPVSGTQIRQNISHKGIESIEEDVPEEVYKKIKAG